MDPEHKNIMERLEIPGSVPAVVWELKVWIMDGNNSWDSFHCELVWGVSGLIAPAFRCWPHSRKYRLSGWNPVTSDTDYPIPWSTQPCVVQLVIRKLFSFSGFIITTKKSSFWSEMILFLNPDRPLPILKKKTNLSIALDWAKNHINLDLHFQI